MILSFRASLLPVLIFVSPAVSQTSRALTTCVSPAGQSAIADRGTTTTWEADGLSGGRVTITQTTIAGDYDVVIESAVDRFSVREDGATITVAPGRTDRAFTLTAIYPLGTVETFALMLDRLQNGTLVWTTVKRQPSGGVRGSVFVAVCRSN